MYQESKVQGLKALVDIILQHEGEDIRWCDVLGVMRWEKYGLTWNIRAAWPEYLLTANFARRTMIWIFRRVAPPSKHLKHLYRNTGVEYKYNIKSDKVWPEWYLVNIYIYMLMANFARKTMIWIFRCVAPFKHLLTSNYKLREIKNRIR